MDNKTNSETLEEGFLGCGNIPKETNSVLSCKLNEKNYRGDVRLVEFHGKLGNQKIIESSLHDGIDGKDGITNATVGSKGSEIKDDVAIWEGDSKRSTDGRIQGGKVEEPLEQCDNVLHCPELASPTTIEVSGKGINLFVEVFGPLDGMSEGISDLSDKVVHILGDGGSNNGDEGVGEQDHTFDVGDLVWVKTRSQLWWPGMISDPSDAASEVKGSEKGASFRVKYFGNANGVWSKCNNAELKPFMKYFDQLSSQTTSRNFVGSVEKALCEIGLRVKSTMTCQCFSRESQTLAAQVPLNNEESGLMSLANKHKSDSLSLSQFECADFVARIRHLARCAWGPGKVELAVMKNRLSAFYCSVGHLELPMELVKSSSDKAQNLQDGPMPELMDEAHDKVSGQRKNSVKTRDDDRYALRGKRNCSDDADRVHDKISSSNKAAESRERKKSKYLIFPYVDVENGRNTKSTVGKEAEDPLYHSSGPMKSTPQGRSNGVTSRKRGSGKPSKGPHKISESDNINASSAELLAELREMARDCFHVTRSKYSNSLKRFYCSFRTSSFLNADKSGKVSRHQQPDGEKGIPEISTEAEVLPKGIKVAKASKKQKVNRASVKKAVDKVVKAVDKVVNNQVSETIDPPANVSASVKKTVDEVVNNQVSQSKVPEANGSASIKKTVEMVIISHVAEKNDSQGKGKGRRRRFKGQPSTSSCGNTYKRRIPKQRGLREIGFQEYCSEGLKNETVPKKSEGCGQQSRSNCAGTDKKDNFDNSSVINFQQTCLDVPKNGTVADKTEGCAQQYSSNCVGTDKKDLPDDSCVFSFQQTYCDVPKSGTAPEKTEGSNPVLPQINSVARLPDLNGNHLSKSAKQIPSGEPSTDLSKPLTKKGKGALVTPSANGVQQTAFPSIPSLKDTSSTIFQNIPKVNCPINGTNHFQTTDSVPGPNVTINSQVISFGQQSLPMEPFPFAGNPERNERKRKQTTQQAASVLPDLNGNVVDTSTSGKAIPEVIPISPDAMPPQKRGKNKCASAESGSNGKINEDPGGTLLLSFAAVCDLPPKDLLVSTFKRYGLLKESEIQVLDDSTVQLVYERSNDVKFAFRSLERRNPFGEKLVNFKINCTVPDPKRGEFQMPKPYTPPVGPRIAHPPKPVGEIPDIAVMKRNVEKMKVTLEQRGHTISPEMRAMLEKEINDFLDKVKNIGGSSSS